MTETANMALSVQSLLSHDEEGVEMDDDYLLDQGPRGRKRVPRRAMLVAALLLAIVVVGVVAYLLVRSGHHATTQVPPLSSAGPFQHGVVAADHETCSRIGAVMLQSGGSAVDAAIASLLCIGVVHSFSSGIGGGGFMLVRNATGVEVIDFREVAPAAATEDMFEGNSTLSQVGGLAVGVPGELRGLELAHKRHGRLPWADLVAPSALLASGGYRVSSALAAAIASSKHYILADPALRKVYAPKGSLAVAGDIISNPALGATLEAVAVGGADAFYSGPIAKAVVADCRAAGGVLTEDDMAAYAPIIRPSINATLFDRFRVYTAPPPAGGSVFLFVVNLVAGFFGAPGTAGLSDPDAKGDAWAGLDYHRFAEACKFAYARRTQLADPAFNATATDVSRKMIDPAEATRVRALITDDSTHDIEYYGPQFDGPENRGTTHVSVLAGDESVSVTSTINLYFGSKVMSSTGVLLNNEMDDFSSPNITNAFGLPPSKVNFIRPGKRPMSSSSPTIVVDEKHPAGPRIVAVLGAAGGTRISSATAYVAVNVLLRNFNIRDAVSIPRIHHQLVPNNVSAEVNIPKSAVTFLRHLGHSVIANDASHAVVQGAVGLADGRVDGMSDPRKGGVAVGY